MENKVLKQIEAKLLSILDDEALVVDKNNVFLAIALVRKLVNNDAIENINASPSDYGEIVLDIELKNDHNLVLFLDYEENKATSYVETDDEIRDFKSFIEVVASFNSGIISINSKTKWNTNTKCNHCYPYK